MMSQFGAPKNPPWARPASDFIAATTATTMPANSLSQAQVASTLLPQAGLASQTVYSLTTTTPNIGQPQFTAQQLAALGLQQQQQQQQAAMQQAPPTAILPQPGIAIPTTLATTQVATVSYPAPRAAQPQTPKQRVFTGTITKLHDNFGFVDEDVFFQLTCVKGSIPKISDRVLVEATYNPNMPFKWNATRIQVLPNQGPGGGPLSAANMMKSQVQSMGNAVGGASVAPMAHLMGGGQPPQPLMQQTIHPGGGLLPAPVGIRPPVPPARRNDPGRFDRDRDRKREHDRDRRERIERPPVARKRSRSRSPVKRSPVPRSRSPNRRRPRIVPRYVVQVPKLSFDVKEANVVTLKSRYGNMYVPSDFFQTSFSWTEAFPLERPFNLGFNCTFHVMHKDVEAIMPNDAVLDPADADHVFSAKVMLVSCPAQDDLYHKSCALAEDPPETKDSFQHPTRLIQFLVGVKGKNEPVAIGGSWSPSLDGPNPAEDPKVLIKTAIRTTKALTGVDLSGCTHWYRFAEVRYLRPEETHKGKLVPARVETTVIFLPDVWSCSPTSLEWATLQTTYKKQLQKKLAAFSSESKDEQTQEEEDPEEVQAEESKEPTHFSELDPKTMKIVDLRRELECRTLSSKGLKSQLIARLTKAIKTEQEKEEAAENAPPEEVANDGGKMEVDDKDEEKKKEEEEKKKKEEREKATLERRYSVSDTPGIIVHPNPQAKGGKFDCAVMSLSVLLDYRPEDNKEHSFEVSLFAELFNEMLMRDFGFEIYKALVSAPEKKEDEKKDKEKDKNKEKDKEREKDKSKTDDKDTKEPASKKKKVDDKKDSEKREGKDRGRKDDEKSGKGTDSDKKDGETEEAEEEEEEDEESKDDKGKKDKDKKKEKRKYVTVHPAMLLGFIYFDQNQTGYLLDKDVEDILHTCGLQLSRAQIRKLVQKLVSRDALNYRKLTDRPVPPPGEEVAEEKIDLDVEKLALGNYEFLQTVKKSTDQQTPRKSNRLGGGEVKESPSSGFVTYKGAVLDVESIIQQLERSEKARAALEKKLQEVIEENDTTKKSAQSKEEVSQKLSSDLKKARQQLTVQEKLTETSEAINKKYMSALMESKDLINSLSTTVSDALKSSPHVKTEHVKNEHKSEPSENGS